MKNIIRFSVVFMWILSSTNGISLPAVPNVFVINVNEVSTLTFNMEDNVVDGAAWLQTFNFDSITPSVPWVSFNSENETIFNSPQIGDIGLYTIEYYVEETGSGSWLFPPSYRVVNLNVNKPPPIINYCFDSKEWKCCNRIIISEIK